LTENQGAAGTPDTQSAIPRRHRHHPNPTLGGFFMVLLVLAVGLLGVGIYLRVARDSDMLLLPGIMATFAVTAIWTLAAQLRGAIHSAAWPMRDKLIALNERVEELGMIITLVSEQQLLSERAKSVAFREKERDTLRRAIQEELAKHDFEAATALANEIERSFGYKQEADRFRQDIVAKRSEVVGKQVNEGIAVIDRHCRGEQWEEAYREADRLIQLFPSEDRVRRLPNDIEARRLELKRQLMTRWRESISRKDKDVDGSIELLKQLDSYLTPAEAEGLQDDARSVLKEKLNSLRQQFSAAVQAHNWAEAIRNGEMILRDFPNTRLAEEIREMMEVLHQRASGMEPVRT
jgi:hypothetical protein